MLTRRDFLATVGAMAGAAACRKSGGVASAGATTSSGLRKLDRIGIQLYTVRRDMQRDMLGTIARIAEIGYREVEFAGYFGRSPAEVREILQRSGLASPSTHVAYELIAQDWDRALDGAATIGHRYVTVPSLPSSARVSADAWRRVADDFNRAGERARARGLRFAYHNHDTEWRSVDGIVPFDLLLARTDPALVAFQMDVFWTVKAGADPLAYLRQHPSRFVMLHVKDSGGPPDHRQVDIGAGTIDFAAILRLDARQKRAIEHVFIEHDSPTDPMAFAKSGFDYMNRLEY